LYVIGVTSVNVWPRQQTDRQLVKISVLVIKWTMSFFLISTKHILIGVDFRKYMISIFLVAYASCAI